MTTSTQPWVKCWLRYLLPPHIIVNTRHTNEPANFPITYTNTTQTKQLRWPAAIGLKNTQSPVKAFHMDAPPHFHTGGGGGGGETAHCLSPLRLCVCALWRHGSVQLCVSSVQSPINDKLDLTGSRKWVNQLLLVVLPRFWKACSHLLISLEKR